jgi:hypothetical protein
MPSTLGMLGYVIEVAKDWTLGRFAAAQTSDFALAPQRFELRGASVRRHALPMESREGLSPLDAVSHVEKPTVWCHSVELSVLIDCGADTVAYEQEAVEILALDDRDVVAQCAFVIRACGLPPCLGPFWSAQ